MHEIIIIMDDSAKRNKKRRREPAIRHPRESTPKFSDSSFYIFSSDNESEEESFMDMTMSFSETGNYLVIILAIACSR